MDENEDIGDFRHNGKVSLIIRQCLIVFFVAIINWGLYVSFCQAYGYPVMGTNLIVIFFSSVIFGIIFALSYKKRLICCITIFVLYIVRILSSYGDIMKQADGILLYIRNRMSVYYSNSSPVYLDNIVDVQDNLSGQALISAVLFASIALMTASVVRGTRFVTVLLVMSVLFVNMMYGKTLEVGTSVYVFIAMVVLCGIAQAKDGKANKNLPDKAGYSTSPVIFLAVITVISFFLGAVSYSVMGEAILIKHDKFLKIQHSAEQKVQEMAADIVGRVERYMDKDRLNNKPPFQTGKKIMTVRSSRLPENSIYLREESSDTYVDNTWSSQVNYKMTDKEAIRMFSKNYSVIDDIVMMNLDSSDSIISSEERLNLQCFNIELEYSAQNSNLIFPYWADIDSAMDASYGAITSVGNDRKLLGNGEKFSFRLYDVGEWIERKLLDQSEKRLSLSALHDDYATHAKRYYGGYPKELQGLISYAGNIKTVGREQMGRQCGYIRAGIWSDVSYSKILGGMPSGADFTENFLFEQKRGYCVHYATAGTLLCRLKDIPARYVTGYKIEPSMFKEVKDRDGNVLYVADVADTAGHAWTEVYKEHLGWVPVEMTEGDENSEKKYDAFVADYDPDLNDDNMIDDGQGIESTTDTDEGGDGSTGNETDVEDGDYDDNSGTDVALDEDADADGNASENGGGKVSGGVDNTLRNNIIIAVSVAVVLALAAIIARYVLIQRKIRAKKKYEGLDRNGKLIAKAEYIAKKCAKSHKIKYKKLDDNSIFGLFMRVGEGDVTKQDIDKLRSILQRSAFAGQEIDADMFGQADGILDRIARVQIKKKSFTK